MNLQQKKHAPRGFRRNFNPGWNEKVEQLNKYLLENGSTNVADKLLHSLMNQEQLISLIQ